MLSILHISDPHAQTETMGRLHNLAYSLPDCDVVALTGDCTSSTVRQLGDELNEWPQKRKFSVPGNHDFADTFDLLDAWEHRAPWSCVVDSVLFVGLDTSNGCGEVSDQLATVADCDTTAIVILSHQWPESYRIPAFEKPLELFVGGRSLLVLHGHAHPSYFPGLLWDDASPLATRRCCRSKVCSSVSGNRGLGHLITWDGRAFTCRGVQGEW